MREIPYGVLVHGCPVPGVLRILNAIGFLILLYKLVSVLFVILLKFVLAYNIVADDIFIHLVIKGVLPHDLFIQLQIGAERFPLAVRQRLIRLFGQSVGGGSLVLGKLYAGLPRPFPGEFNKRNRGEGVVSGHAFGCPAVKVRLPYILPSEELKAVLRLVHIYIKFLGGNGLSVYFDKVIFLLRSVLRRPASAGQKNRRRQRHNFFQYAGHTCSSLHGVMAF